MNIAIMRAFIELCKGEAINRTEVSKIELLDDRLGKFENKLSQVFEQMKTLTKTGSQASENPTQAELVSQRSARPIEKIQNAVARYFGIKEQSLKLAGRGNSIVLPRQIAMHLVRKHLGTSFKSKGHFLKKIFELLKKHCALTGFR